MVDAAAEGQITLKIDNKKPIELLDLTASLAALGSEYLRHIEQEHPEDQASEVRLYVNEIRTGSVLATLAAASPQIIEMGTYALSVISFVEKLSEAYGFLTGLGRKPDNLDKKMLENLSSIVEPIAKDAGSQLNIGTNNGNVFLVVTSNDANRAQNTIHRLLEDEATTSTRYHEKVVLYWHQARNDVKSGAGDRGIIESISDAPVKVMCVNERIKQQMVLDVENPFREAYLVDVAVETIKGKPAVYKVMALYDKIPRDD